MTNQVDAIMEAAHDRLFPEDPKPHGAGDLNLFPPDLTMLIVAHVVIPILTKVISDVLVDKYKSARTEKQVKEALADIKLQVHSAHPEALDDPELMNTVKHNLLENGFNESEATKAAGDLLSLVRERLQKS